MQNENSSLGSKVSDSRKKLGLSQEALAEKVPYNGLKKDP